MARSLGSSRAASRAALACQPLGKSSAASVPLKAARRSSSSAWTRVVPRRMREAGEASGLPGRPAGEHRPAQRRVVAEAEVVVRREVDPGRLLEGPPQPLLVELLELRREVGQEVQDGLGHTGAPVR